jgi:hypothetical protein
LVEPGVLRSQVVDEEIPPEPLMDVLMTLILRGIGTEKDGRPEGGAPGDEEEGV